MSNCLSDFAFDRLLARELEGEALENAEAHIASCDRCRARMAAISSEKEAFASHAPELVRRAGAPSKRWLAFAATGAAALAAAAMLVLQVHPSTNAGESTRLKGGAHIGFFVKHGDGVSRGYADEAVAPGDSLRFVYTSATDGYIAVLSVDGSRHASIYYPDGPNAVHANAAVDEPLPNSVVLDATLGREKLYGLFCHDPIALEPVRAALERQPDTSPAIEGCEVDATSIQKNAVPNP
ncbi:MAG: DUF4384 domain-containing protein [Polyangiaceae bacterium]